VAANAAPSALESQFSQATLQASLARQARGLTNPLQPTGEVLRAGQEIFKNDCAGCHGEQGKPSLWGTQCFYPRVPQFNDQPPNLTAPQMFVAIKYGIRYSGMGGWNGQISDEKIWQVATFLEHIKSVPPEAQASPTPAQ
jgi:mono/diheme cytochrome c family protein